MKVKRYLFNGLSFVSIVDEWECPVDPYLSCYLSNQVSAFAPNTRLRYANELLFVHEYFTSKNISLSDRVASGKLISEKEYIQFYDWSSTSSAGVLETDSPISLNVKNKRIRNIISANQKNNTKVSNETIQGRIRRLRNFLKWLFDNFHESIILKDELNYRLNKLVARIKLDEHSLGRNRSQKVMGPEESVIDPGVFNSLTDMLSPASKNNPFKRSKVRNFLIVNILIESAIRRGALAKLKISDLHLYKNFDQFAVYRSKDDPSDTRLEKPNHKTKSHLATISPGLMERVKFYVDNVRVHYPVSELHDFLFVSENSSKGTAGQPLSLKAINAIFQKLSKVLNFRIHPHLFRHKWNEVYDDKATASGIDPRLVEDLRKFSMGWKHNSGMAQIYNEKSLALKARELSRVHQERVDHSNE